MQDHSYAWAKKGRVIPGPFLKPVEAGEQYKEPLGTFSFRFKSIDTQSIVAYGKITGYGRGVLGCSPSLGRQFSDKTRPTSDRMLTGNSIEFAWPRLVARPPRRERGRNRTAPLFGVMRSGLERRLLHVSIPTDAKRHPVFRQHSPIARLLVGWKSERPKNNLVPTMHAKAAIAVAL
jgi:hypothetical protein